MTKKQAQDAPTKPRPVDKNGHTLDEHGLPLSGPARLAALGGKPDPALVEAPAEPAPAPDAPADAPSTPATQD